MQVPPAPNTLSQAFIHPFLQISSTLAISHTREQNRYWRATHAPPTNVYLRCNDEDDNENVKKATSLISKTTTSHVHQTFLYISFPFLHDYDVKMPNFAFYGGRRQATTIYFSFWAWIWSLENSTSGGFAYNWQSKWVGIIAIKTERTEIHFFSDVIVAVASMDLKVPSSC